MDVDLDDIIQLVKTGQREAAVPLLIDALRKTPENPRLWLWLSRSVPERTKKIDCLKRCLRYDPDNKHAKKELAYYQEKSPKEATPTPKIADAYDAPVDIKRLKAQEAIADQKRLRLRLIFWRASSVIAVIVIAVMMFLTGAFLYSQILVLPPIVDRSVSYYEGVPTATPPGHLFADSSYVAGLSALENEELESAVTHFLESIEKDPTVAAPYIHLSLGYFRLDEMGAGLEAVQTGLSLDPNYPRGYTTRALYWIERGRFAQAKQDLEYALYLDPTLSIAYQNFGVYYFQQGRYDDVIEMAEKALFFAPDDKRVHLLLAKTYLNSSNYSDCITSSTRVIELAPDLADAYFTRGTCYLYTAAFQDAVYDFDQFLVFEPNNRCGIMNRNMALARLGETQIAQAETAVTLGSSC